MVMKVKRDVYLNLSLGEAHRLLEIFLKEERIPSVFAYRLGEEINRVERNNTIRNR